MFCEYRPRFLNKGDFHTLASRNYNVRHIKVTLVKNVYRYVYIFSVFYSSYKGAVNLIYFNVIVQYYRILKMQHI